MSRPLVVGIMASAPAEIAAAFLSTHAARLAVDRATVAVLVLDDNDALSGHPVKERWKMAQRQARISGCTRLSGMVRIGVYQAMLSRGLRGAGASTPRLPDAVEVVRVPNLNRPEAIGAIAAARCDLICLMGARILTAKTLEMLGAPVVNIHSSDPAWVRGGPVVVWEVLDGRDEIQLTVHEVVAALDAGAILASTNHRVRFVGGIASTTRRTMRDALPAVCDLFARVIEQHRDGTLQRVAFVPGKLRVTPSVTETLRAELLCRIRTRRQGRAAAHRGRG